MWPEMIDRKQAFQNVGWFDIDGGDPDVILTIQGFLHTGLYNANSFVIAWNVITSSTIDACALNTINLI